MTGLVYLDGEYVDRAAATISVEDRGFIFGDGVYDVWRVVHGRLFEHGRHIERLARGLAALAIERPAVATEEGIAAVAEHLLLANSLARGEATLYLEITRGAAPRTHHFPPPGTPPTVFMAVNPFTPAYAPDARGRVSTVPIPVITAADVRWLRCDVKTVQLLPNVLAKQEAVSRGAGEAVLVRDGMVTEGTHTSVFAVLGGELRTHPPGNLILPSVTRALVLELARGLGIAVREEAVTAEELREVDELFIASTTSDVTPVTSVDGRTVGSGAAGPVTLALFDALRARLDLLAAPA